MLNEYKHLIKLKNEMMTCTMCGYCKMVCPVYLEVGWDSSSPRGRMTLAYGLLTGDVEPDDSIAERLFQCTACTDCYRRCPSKAKCPDIVVAARRELIERGFAAESQLKLIDNIEKSGNIFADFEMEHPEQEGEQLIFIGCQHLSRPNSTKKTLKLLKTLGIKPLIMKETCCGFPMEVMGFERAHQRQAEKLKQIFPLDGRSVMTFCPSCLVHLQKNYGQPAIHVLQEIDKLIQHKDFVPEGTTVTYHDPCDLSRGAQITKEPRSILKAMGYRIVEMAQSKDLSRCCGGGGGILSRDSKLSGMMGLKRIENAKVTGAAMIVTACATCEQTLKKASLEYSANRNEPPMPVRHILDLVAKAVKS